MPLIPRKGDPGLLSRWGVFRYLRSMARGSSRPGPGVPTYPLWGRAASRSSLGPRLPLWLVCALSLAACGKPATSEVVEFCIPLEEGEAGELPVARVILDYKSYDPESRPTEADTHRFLVATEVPMTTLHRDLAPITTADGSSIGQQRTDLAVVDAVSSLVVGRATFWNLRTLSAAFGSLGPSGAEASYSGILGGDVLRQYAVRFQLQADPRCKLPWLDLVPSWPSITFFREIPDTHKELSNDGFGVILYTIAGGGFAEIQDDQFEFPATRVTVPACVEPAPFDPSVHVDNLEEGIPLSGVDAQVLIATGTQPILLSESFFERLVAVRSRQDPTWTVSPVSAGISLLEGEVAAQRFPLQRMALVGNRSGGLSPCGELRRRRWIEYAERCRVDPTCPPISDREWEESVKKKGSGVLEVDVTRGTGSEELTAMVVPDETRLFSGLRAETGSQIPAIDLLVGAAFLKHFELILDYKESRIVMRCVDYQVPTARQECDPDAPTGSDEKTCCPSESALVTGGQSCCQTNAYQEADRGFRLPRSCSCRGSPCCQYFRYDPEEK